MNAAQFKTALAIAVDIVTDAVRRGHPQGNRREHLLAQAVVTMRSRILHILANPANVHWVERKGVMDGTENILESLHYSWARMRAAALARPAQDETGAGDATTTAIQNNTTSRLTIQERRIMELYPQLVAYARYAIVGAGVEVDGAKLLEEIDKVVE